MVELKKVFFLSKSREKLDQFLGLEVKKLTQRNRGHSGTS